MNKISLHPGFTLIEVIISVSIMSIILVAIMGVFFSMSDVSNKTEINRQLQSNLKNAIELMAEDIRSYGIDTSCSVLWSSQGTYWCSNNGNRYYVGRDNGIWWHAPADIAECAGLKNQCFLMKNNTILTNSFLSVESAHFEILWDDAMKRLSISLLVAPSASKWVKPNLVKQNRFHFQTTLSENFLKQ